MVSKIRLYFQTHPGGDWAFSRVGILDLTYNEFNPICNFIFITLFGNISPKSLKQKNLGRH